MRVIQINNSSETFTATASGAIATHIWEVARVVAQKGGECVVLSQDAPQPALAGVPLVRVPVRSKTGAAWRQQLWRVERKLFGWREPGQRGYACEVVRALKRGGFEDDWIFLHNDPELAVHLRDVFPKARLLHHFHNPVACHPRFRRRFARAATLTTAVSGFVADEVERIYGCPRVEVILNGVDLERFKPVDGSLERRGDQPVTLNFLGRTGIEKAPDLFLRAALGLARLGMPIRVQLMGANHWGRWEPDAFQGELSRVCAQIVECGVDVFRTGHVVRADVPGHLANADVHVVPSRWDEPCALSLLEGMAAGLAVVASRTGGTAELLDGAGRLFERDSESGLVAHLLELVSNREERLALAAKARRRAEHLSWSVCWGRFENAMC